MILKTDFKSPEELLDYSITKKLNRPLIAVIFLVLNNETDFTRVASPHFKSEVGLREFIKWIYRIKVNKKLLL